jgi:hypothetical protein
LLPPLAGAGDPSPFPTLGEWAQAVELAESAAQKSEALFEPYLLVAENMANACMRGQVKSATRPIAGGELVERDWHFWNGENLGYRFDTCQIDETAPFNPASSGATSWLYIDRKTLEDFIAKRPADTSLSTDADAALKERSIQRARKGAAGRTPAYRWDDMMSEFVRMLYRNEFTKETSARAIATKLADWAAKNWEQPPNVETIADKVRVWRTGMDDAD